MIDQANQHASNHQQLLKFQSTRKLVALSLATRVLFSGPGLIGCLLALTAISTAAWSFLAN
jgi:hypothetical protein